MTNRDIIIFGSGLGIGIGSGILATMQYFKKKYSTIADQQIAEMEEYYGKDNYIRQDTRIIEDDADEVNPINEDGEPDRTRGVLDQDARDEIKKKLLDNYARSSEMATNYAQISKELFEQKRAEVEHPEDDEEEEPITETPEEIADYEHKQNFNKPPRIISLEEYNSLPGNIDTQTLYFYLHDGVVTDDDENEIPDPETLIGDSLTKYGFDEDDEEMIIFVMNYQLDTAYEIQKVIGAYSDGE